MDILNKIMPNFLRIERITNLFSYVITSPETLSFFVIINTPLVYTIYDNTFTMNNFVFAYLGCGILQGVINFILYHVSDILFFGKPIDVNSWKKTNFYEVVVFNIDAAYIFVLGALVYTSLTVVPESIRWTMVYPGYTSIILQVLLLAILHDFLFTIIHYVVHKIKYLRIPHLKWHHECPFDIGTSRCAVSSPGIEALVRDIYSAIIPTYILGYFGLPFYGNIWIFYYTLYSFWAMYIHTGVNVYHNLHHSKNPNLNYGLYYITDYFMGTLVLKEKEKEK